MSYMIGTGYYDNPTSAAFFKTWMANTQQFAKPADIVVVNSAGRSQEASGGTWINLRHNYGHVKTMDRRERFGGWWVGFMTGALISFGHGLDFIYKEQDCLAFGPWVEKLYEDHARTKAPVVTGSFAHKYKIEQSLVFVRRKFIPTLISMYVSIPETDSALRPELKFLRIMKGKPGSMAYMSMGCGRNRPIPYKAPCFYAQKLTPPELAKLALIGLL